MATTPRTIRFDDDLYDGMKGIAKRPMTAAYHIQEACRQYLASFAKPVTTVKMTAPPIPKPILDEGLFEQVWELYGRKGNKKTSRLRFNNLNDVNRALLLKHIHDYVVSTPDKQFRKDFQSYINLECWNDEVITQAPHQQAPKAGMEQLRDTSWAAGMVEGGDDGGITEGRTQVTHQT
jgi:hypothetical protein